MSTLQKTPEDVNKMCHSFSSVHALDSHYELKENNGVYRMMTGDVSSQKAATNMVW